jgi:ADP-heptose:LPS heptosyltransferase
VSSDSALIPLVPEARKIAILRANALGDLVFSLPALYSLREAYPDSEIVLLGRPLHRELLMGRPSPVDRVEIVPPIPGLVDGPSRDREEPDLFVDRMRAERFDLAIQMHGGGGMSNPFLLRLGARITVGMRTPDAGQLDRWIPYVYYQPEVMRYLELVSLIGVRPVTYQPSLPVTRQDHAEVTERLDLRERYVVLHPGATDARRRWPATGFAEVGDRFVEAGHQVVLTGTEPERKFVEEVFELMRVKPIPAVGRLSLGGLAGLLSGAAVVVANDTGPLHLADAVGARTVGIYWCGNLVNSAPFNRTRHRPLASWRIRCPRCGADCTQDRCDHPVSYVADVPVSEVVAAALDLERASSIAG